MASRRPLRPSRYRTAQGRWAHARRLAAHVVCPTRVPVHQHAAGALAHLMLKLTPHLPTPLPRQVDDLGTPVLRFLERLMVAQAAECYYQRLVLGTRARPLVEFDQYGLTWSIRSPLADQSVPTAATVLPQVAAVIENHYDHLKGLYEATVPRGAFASSPLPKVPAVYARAMQRGFRTHTARPNSLFLPPSVRSGRPSSMSSAGFSWRSRSRPSRRRCRRASWASTSRGWRSPRRLSTAPRCTLPACAAARSRPSSRYALNDRGIASVASAS